MCDLKWSHPPGSNRRPADYEEQFLGSKPSIHSIRKCLLSTTWETAFAQPVTPGTPSRWGSDTVLTQHSGVNSSNITQTGGGGGGEWPRLPFFPTPQTTAPLPLPRGSFPGNYNRKVKLGESTTKNKNQQKGGLAGGAAWGGGWGVGGGGGGGGGGEEGGGGRGKGRKRTRR